MQAFLSDALYLDRFRRELCSMPACDHPDGPVLTTIEETIGRHNHLAKGKIGKLGNQPTGLRISHEASECALSLLPEFQGCRGVVLQNKGHCREKLDASGGCEAEPHLGPPARRASASASTSSRSNPSPAAISCSPRASKCRIWRSRSLRS